MPNADSIDLISGIVMASTSESVVELNPLPTDRLSVNRHALFPGRDTSWVTSWIQRTHDKIKDVDWRKVFLVAIICTGNFVVFCSISLIGAFFPTEVC